MPSQFKESNTNNSINFNTIEIAQEDEALSQYTINSSAEGSQENDTLVATFGYVDGYWGYDILIADYSDYETAIENVDSRNYIKRINDNVDLLSFSSIENYYITGTQFNDSLQASVNDSLDGGEGKDRLSLDFSTVTESVLIDFTNSDNQVTFNNTIVQNFETIETIYGGSNDDKIKLSSSASASGGEVDGLYGNDLLVLDYSDYEVAIENVDSSSRVARIDNNVDLIYYYSIDRYQITATAFNDSLQGSTFGDTLIGGSGDDFIEGNSGGDILIGVNYNSENAGIGEIDTLLGGTNKDIFVLGNAEKIFYNNKLDDKIATDYALIQNFDTNEDIIHLSGSKDDYSLDTSPVKNILGTAIYKIEDNNKPQNRELIAVIENVTRLNIESDTFKNITKDNEEPNIEYSTAHEKGYQISRLAVGLNVSSSDFSDLESELIADSNKDGLISAFDAYLTYFSK